MTLAIMQPYIFPYLGYFQLVNAVDRFVFFDDVNFIKRGWINRNRILVNGKDHMFTIPLQGASQNSLIKDILVSDDERWKDKLLKKIEFSYKKAPFFEAVFPMISSIIHSDYRTISELSINSIKTISEYLNIDTEFKLSSESYANQDLKGQVRCLDICKTEEADKYINVIAGLHIYDKENFTKEGIEMHFITPKEVQYEQAGNEFVPYLSIIDSLMFNDKDFLIDALGQYELS